MKKKKKHVPLFCPVEASKEFQRSLLRDIRSCALLYHTAPAPLLKKLEASQDQQGLKKLKQYDHDLKQVSISAFLENLERLGRFNFCLPSRKRSGNVYGRDRLLYRAQAFVHHLLGTFSYEEAFLASKHGPGVSTSTSFTDSSVEAKFAYPISGTSEAVKLFREFLEYDTVLDDAISEFNRFSTEPRYRLDVGSRLTTVPKDDRRDRIIAIEPTLNMFFQQGIMALMAERLSNYGHDLSCVPDRHQKLTFESSVTGRLSTIDFSMASDSIALPLVRFLLPDDWFSALMTVRCHETEVNGETKRLPMISTMGNATTFPLETVIFLSLAFASSQTYVGMSIMPSFDDDWFNSVSVFGDDCILPSQYADVFCQLAESVGFIVNLEKSFTQVDKPIFRESCGVDVTDFRNVRPLFFKAPPATDQKSLEAWLYVIANEYIKKIISIFGTHLYCYATGFWDLWKAYFSKIPTMVKLVPDYFPSDSGLCYLGDRRILSNFEGLRFSPIHISNHGTASFRFLHYQYDKGERNDDVRYALLLRSGGVTPKAPFVKVIKRKGRYVESRRGISSHSSLSYL